MMLPERVATSIELNWSDDDLKQYSWLRRPTRYYSLVDKLGSGSFGTAYSGLPYPSLRATVAYPKADQIVVKIPNTDPGEYTAKQNRSRLDYIRTKNHKEFLYLRQRLHGCTHASPILDLATISDGEFELPVTIQLLLKHACDLDQWLVNERLKPPLDQTLRGKQATSAWKGISDRQRWVDIALSIASALKEIHLRRVTHGDIHPGNIFVNSESPYHIRFIDFGEGFTATPDLNWRLRTPNPYVAPERLGPRFPLNGQVDIYAFGILLLYLATGTPTQLPFANHPGTHKLYIQGLVSAVNPSLVRHEPRIADLIGRCTARDPADRPRMADICADLIRVRDDSQSSRPVRGDYSALTLERITKEIEYGAARHSPVLMTLLDQQIQHLANTIDGLQTEMVELYGTRDQMLRVMLSLLDHLYEGDSWTSCTTLAVWQRSALGLNGSYLSANSLALRRGAAIRRTFVVSIAELGVAFSEALAARLKASATIALRVLGKRFEKAIVEHQSKSIQDNYLHPNQDFILWHRRRLVSLIESLQNFIYREELGSYLFTESAVSITKSLGLYLGLCPVSTLDDIGAIREDNPVSIMHLPKEADDTRQWLLVSTELRGRNEAQDGIERPHLLGVRVYKSVMGGSSGRPNDRINYLEELMNKQAVNFGSVIEELNKIVSVTDKDTPPE